MHDNVNHPKHYTGFSNGAEVIDITENCTFNTGNAIKYAARAGRTDGNVKGNILEDLNKAKWYIEREIGRISGLVQALWIAVARSLLSFAMSRPRRGLLPPLMVRGWCS